MLAELERVRSHVGTICAICGSTGLAVAESQAAILEEELLRLCGATAGHRYLFGLNMVGGLTADIDDPACRTIDASLSTVGAKLRDLESGLVNSSSFLDRLEEVGVIDARHATEFGLAGPVARASGCPSDLRKSHPYSGYELYTFDAAVQQEGDGYARLRVLFFEAAQSISVVRQAIQGLLAGPVRAHATASGPAAAAPTRGVGREIGERHSAPGRTGFADNTFGFGWVEAPGGAAAHLLWLAEDGTVDRYRVVPPSFFNWHGFHLAAEGFAFQDFPIILATFGLSVAESDR
jgi:Ni,Fe-hydrogenase III large subunit